MTRLKTNQAQRAMRHMIEALVVDGLSRDEISDIFKNALALEGKG